jgi:hypothetical protein
MKRISMVFLLTLLPTVPALAVQSVSFSTAEGAMSSWQLQNVGGAWQLSFVDNATIVDDSDPDDPVLIGDRVDLPAMVLSDIRTIAPGVLAATLTPAGSLTVQADTTADGVSAGDTVLTASVEASTFITAGTNYIAFSAIRDDLDVLQFAGGYGQVVPALAAEDASGLPFDLSFSGDSHVDLVGLLTGTDLRRTASGNISGAMATVIPAPGALLLTALGTLLTGWLRRRKFV